MLFVLSMVQGTPAEIQTVRGRVYDQTGAVLQGAAVALTDAEGRVVRASSTGPQGEFAIERVPPGVYVLRVAFAGFRAAAINLAVGPRRAVPLQSIVLQLASQAQELTVNAADVLAAGANANRDAVVLTDKELKNLPIFDRNVVGTLARFLDASALGSGGVTLVVDGVEARKVGVAPSAIQQVKINQDPYAAEFPRPGRGRIEVVTKAGTDKYSGSMDLTFREAHLNARDPFSTTRPPEQRRIYEGVFGGPVFDGKHTSFLTTIDRSEENLQAIVVAQGPAGLINAVVPQPDRGLELSGSLAHQLDPRNSVSVRATYEGSSSRNQRVGGTTLAESGADARGRESQVVTGLRSVLNDRLVHEFRLLLGHESGATASVNPGRGVVVLDAFTAGGAQSDQTSREDHFTISDSTTYIRGKHLLKAGFQIPDFSRRAFDDRSNRAGTFTFSSLEDYALGRPLSFVRQQGDGSLVFLQKVFGLFVQDQINVSDRLSVTPGLRYDWQNLLRDRNNVAPRLSIAYAISTSTMVRGGAGLFYDRAGDGAIREVVRSREDRLQRVILLAPAYPEPFGSGADAANVRSIVTLSPEIRTPLTAQYGVGVERILRKGTTVTFNYLGARGLHLFRSRDVNAPVPPLFEARPDASFGQIRQIESTARQTAHSLQVTARGRLAPHIRGSLQYSFASTHNDTNGINALPANNYDLRSEWGRASFDQRSKLEALLQLSFAPWADFGVAVSLASGRPYTLQTGRDDFHSGQTNARPSGVSRNTLQGPGSAVLDLRWSHEFGFGRGEGDERPAWSLGVDAFNVVNRVNYSGYVGTITSPFFGRAVSAQPPRRLQLSAGFHF
ncbi:MAG: TonB-dependent receptor [Vicinamibacterales bacterium]